MFFRVDNQINGIFTFQRTVGSKKYCKGRYNFVDVIHMLFPKLLCIWVVVGGDHFILHIYQTGDLD